MNKLLLVIVFLFSVPGHAKSIEAFFNHNRSVYYTDPYYNRTRYGDNLELVLLKAIAAARVSIDLAVYDFNLPLVAAALAQKHQQGVRIRIVLDNDNSKPVVELTPQELARLSDHNRSKYLDFFAFADLNRDRRLSPEELAQRDGLTILKNAGIQWLDDTADGSRGSSLMHHKFLVVDSQIVITGSTNFTRSCVHGDYGKPYSLGNANSLLQIRSAPTAQLFTEEFEQMWTGRRFGSKKAFRPPRYVQVEGATVKIQFSPVSPARGYEASVNGLISREIEMARISANLALFVFSEQRLADSLRYAHSRGVLPNALIDPSFATREYSELLDLWGLQFKSEKCALEAGNNPWTPGLRNSGFTVLSDGDVLHHKFAVLDASTVIVGSHNWSEAANSQNDEALLIIGDRDVAAKYETEFRTQWSRSVIGPQPWLLSKIQERDRSCGAGF